MPIRRANLNDLLALEALLAERHITRAAQRCGVTQSAMSHALRRLRDTLGDPLLVRGRSGFVLTPRAARLARVVTRALAELQDAMFVAPVFDPATSERTFHVACVDLIIPMLVPLMRTLERQAPEVSLIVHQLDPAGFLQQLEDDELDVVLLGPEPAPGMCRRHLYDEHLVCVLHAEHPAAREPFTLEAFLSLRHAIIAPHDGVMADVNRMMEERGVALRVVLRLPYFVAGTMAAALCDLALLVPQSTAVELTRLIPAVIRDLPIDLPALPITQVWHPKSSEDDGALWFRDAMRSAVAAALQ